MLPLLSRRQEFVELVRVGDAGGAIKYARAHLADWAEPCEEEHQRAFAALVFTASSPCPQYKVLPALFRSLPLMVQCRGRSICCATNSHIHPWNIWQPNPQPDCI